MKVRFSNLFLDCAALTVASTDSICYCLDVLHLSFESSAAVSFWQLSYREVVSSECMGKTFQAAMTNT